MAKGQKGTKPAAKSGDAVEAPAYSEVYLYDEKTGAYLGPFETTNGEEPDTDNYTEEKPPTHDVYVETAIFKNGDWSTVKNSVLEEAAKHKITRDRLLAGCDWTQLQDSQVDVKAWAAYRQELRDLTAQKGFPEAIKWPAQPSSAPVVVELAKDAGKDAGK